MLDFSWLIWNNECFKMWDQEQNIVNVKAGLQKYTFVFTNSPSLHAKPSDFQKLIQLQ